MHRSEDDYLLTTHLFCGKCGAMMTGEIGTSHTSTKYRYYKCNQAKKKKCGKKTVRKEWIENYVINTIFEFLSDDSAIEELAERVYRLQELESAESVMLKSQLAEVQFKLKNLTEALALGIYSDTTKQMLDDLETQKKNIEADMIQLEIRNPVIPKEQIAFALYNYRKLDMSVQSDRQKLIDSFVNSIYLYDDYFIITFNYKNKSKKVSLKEINSSSLTSSTPPIQNAAFGRHFGLVEPGEGNRTDQMQPHPNRDGAAGIRVLLDLRNYQMCRDWTGATSQRGNCQCSGGTFRIAHR